MAATTSRALSDQGRHWEHKEDSCLIPSIQTWLETVQLPPEQAAFWGLRNLLLSYGLEMVHRRGPPAGGETGLDDTGL